MDRPSTRGDSTSASLLERAVGRDELAWSRLVSLYRPLVIHWCRGGGLPSVDCEDVAQETMIAVAAGLPEFRRQREGSFRAWVRGITRHKVADRRRKRVPVADGGSEARLRINEIPSPDDPPTAGGEAAEATWLYRRALDLVRSEFTDRTWRAFWSTAVEDRPVDIVAAELGMTTVAVRIAKSRVLARLREEVGDVLD